MKSVCERWTDKQTGGRVTDGQKRRQTEEQTERRKNPVCQAILNKNILRSNFELSRKRRRDISKLQNKS